MNKGFIALFSVIIISFVLLLLTVSLNFSSLLGRFNILDSEVREESTETADACVEAARLVRALENQAVGVAEDYTVADDRICFYKFTSNDEVDICAEVGGSYTFYKVEFDSSDAVFEFEETSSISGICGIL